VNKAEFISAAAQRCGLSKKDTEAAATAIFEAITAALREGDKVQLIGFGTFETKVRAARTGYNIQTGTEMDIPEARLPVFKPGKTLKDAVAVGP